MQARQRVERVGRPCFANLEVADDAAASMPVTASAVIANRWNVEPPAAWRCGGVPDGSTSTASSASAAARRARRLDVPHVNGIEGAAEDTDARRRTSFRRAIDLGVVSRLRLAFARAPRDLAPDRLEQSASSPAPVAADTG